MLHVRAGWTDWIVKGKAIAWSEDGKLLRTDRGLAPVPSLDQLLAGQEHDVMPIQDDALHFPSYGQAPGPSLAELSSSFAPGTFSLWAIDCTA